MSRKSKHAVSTESGNVVLRVRGVSNWQGWLLAKVLLMMVIQSCPGANKLTIAARHTPGTVGCCGGGVVLKRRDGISTGFSELRLLWNWNSGTPLSMTSISNVGNKVELQY